jgi:hypothetical protein
MDAYWQDIVIEPPLPSHLSYRRGLLLTLRRRAGCGSGKLKVRDF